MEEGLIWPIISEIPLRGLCVGCFGGNVKAEHHDGALGIGHFSHHGDEEANREEKMDDPSDPLLFHWALPPPNNTTNWGGAFNTAA